VVNGEMYIEKLKAEFKTIDQDGNGLVEKAELVEMAKNLQYGLSEEELDNIVKDMDSDHDGMISLEEFIASAVSNIYLPIHASTYVMYVIFYVRVVFFVGPLANETIRMNSSSSTIIHQFCAGITTLFEFYYETQVKIKVGTS
jgi:hypothetical protein